MNDAPEKSKKESTQDEASVCTVIERAFCTGFYLASNPDVRNTSVEPLHHYVRSGWKEGRDPSVFFSTSYYLDTNQDVADAGTNPLYHYLTSGLQEGRRPLPLPPVYAGNEAEYERVRRVVGAEFEREFYASSYPEALEQMRDPLDHFLFIGWWQGHDPAAWFSVDDYLHENAAALTAKINPFYHYIVIGRIEGRLPRCNRAVEPLQSVSDAVRKLVATEFDREFYLQINSDVRVAGIDPLEHYLSDGWREGRDPNPFFSTAYYLQSSPDVRERGFDPFYHYLLSGRQEGRLARLPGGHVIQALQALQRLDELLNNPQPIDNPAIEPDSAASFLATIEPMLGNDCRRMVVSISHDDYALSVGGVQNCIMQEQAAVNQAEAVYLNLNPLCPLPRIAHEQDAGELQLNIRCNGEYAGVVSATDCLAVLLQCRDRFATVDLVVHALFGHLPGFVAALGESVITGQSIYWIHDYQAICPGYNLLRNGVSYCGAPPYDSMACSICIYGEERTRQHEPMRELFETVSFTLIAPSEYAAEFWKQHCNLSYQDMVVQPHTTFVKQPGVSSMSGSGADSTADVLRVAFIGYPAFHKGWPVFKRLVDENRHNTSLKFHHLAVSPVDDVVGLDYTPVGVTGENPAAMVEALADNNIDLALVWSVWPETYCLSAHEAAAAGVVILTSNDSGNVARFVAENDCGIVFRNETDLYAAFSTGRINEMLATVRERKDVARMGLLYRGMSADVLQLGRDD